MASFEPGRKTLAICAGQAGGQGGSRELSLQGCLDGHDARRKEGGHCPRAQWVQISRPPGVMDGFPINMEVDMGVLSGWPPISAVLKQGFDMKCLPRTAGSKAVVGARLEVRFLCPPIYCIIALDDETRNPVSPHAATDHGMFLPRSQPFQ